MKIIKIITTVLLLIPFLSVEAFFIRNDSFGPLSVELWRPQGNGNTYVSQDEFKLDAGALMK